LPDGIIAPRFLVLTASFLNLAGCLLIGIEPSREDITVVPVCAGRSRGIIAVFKASAFGRLF
jgi:hypothetical protein